MSDMLQIGAILVPVASGGEVEPEEGGAAPWRALDGTLRRTQRWIKRNWRFTASEMSQADYETLRTLVLSGNQVCIVSGITVTCYVRVSGADFLPDGGSVNQAPQILLREV